MDKADNIAEVDNISEWLRQNKLSLNTDKTEYMVVGHKRQTNRIHGPLEVDINGGPIKRVKKVKYLGVTVDENLTWNEQNKNLKVKLKMPRGVRSTEKATGLGRSPRKF